MGYIRVSVAAPGLHLGTLLMTAGFGIPGGEGQESKTKYSVTVCATQSYALATSFAPMPKAAKRAAMAPKTTIQAYLP